MKYSEIQIITTKITSIAFCYLFYRTTDRTDNISYAKSQASSSWDDYFESYPSRFCTCGNNKTWSANIGLNKSCGGIYDVLTSIPYQMNYDNECGGSKSVSMSWSCTKSTNTGGGSASGSVTISIPSGSGHTTGSASLGGTECTCTTLTFTSSGVKSGSC